MIVNQPSANGRLSVFDFEARQRRLEDAIVLATRGTSVGGSGIVVAVDTLMCVVCLPVNRTMSPEGLAGHRTFENETQ